jgi:hypothetical protein
MEGTLSRHGRQWVDKGEGAHITHCLSELCFMGSSRTWCNSGLRVIRWQAFCADVQRYTLLRSQLTSLTNIRLQMTVSGALTSSMATPSAATLFLGLPPHSLDHLFTRNNLVHTLLCHPNALPVRVVTISSEYGATVKILSRGWRRRRSMDTQIGFATLHGHPASVCQGVISRQRPRFVTRQLILDFFSDSIFVRRTRQC